MANIKFYRGVKANYDATTHANGLFFCTDTFEIYLNDHAYGGADLGLAANKVVKSISTNAENETIIDVLYTDGTTGTINIPAATYTSGITDKELAMPNAVGGFAKGTKVSALEDKTYNEMFDDLLFPTINPTYTNPTASLSFTGYSALVEAGVAGPSAANFTSGYNAGAINLNGVKQNNRGGAHDADTSFIYVGDPAVTEFPATVALGTTTFKYRAYYAEGPQPLNNKGVATGAPYPAGSVDSTALSLVGTYPWFATTSSGTIVAGSELRKQGLLSWKTSAGTMQTPEFDVRPVGETPQQIKLPRAMTEMKMKNTVSGNMDIVSTADWAKTEEVTDINGNAVTYFIYTYTGSSRSSVTLQVKF